jgi:hypothetical protein
MPQIPSDPELRAIESALGGFIPVPSRLDRDKLMFQAGAASARSAARRRWVWPSIAATLTAALVFESLALAVRPGPRVVERVVVVHEPVPGTATSAARAEAIPNPAPADFVSEARSPVQLPLAVSWPVTSDYQRIQELVLLLGLDALPERPSPLLSRSDGQVDPIDTPVQSAGLLRRLELEKLLNPGGPS